MFFPCSVVLSVSFELLLPALFVASDLDFYSVPGSVVVPVAAEPAAAEPVAAELAAAEPAAGFYSGAPAF